MKARYSGVGPRPGRTGDPKRILTRALVFSGIALVILLRARKFLDFFGLGEHYWWLSLILAIAIGLVFAFYPMTCCHGLAQPVLLLLGAICILEIGFFFALIMLCIAIEVVVPIGFTGLLGYALIKGSYVVGAETGASIAAVVFIAALLPSAKPAYLLVVQIVSNTERWARRVIEESIERPFPLPIILMRKVFQCATEVGRWLRGDINDPSEGMSTEPRDFREIAATWTGTPGAGVWAVVLASFLVYAAIFVSRRLLLG